MKEDFNRQSDISIKDLCCLLLKRIGVVLLVSLVCAGVSVLLALYKSSNNGNVTVGSDKLNISERLAEESEEEYYNRVVNVTRANDILSNIVILTDQVESQNDYISNSLLMKIDPLNTACTLIQFNIICDGNAVGEIEAIYNACARDLSSVDYLYPIASSTGYSTGAIQELISCELYSDNNNTVFIAEDSDQIGTMLISVIGASTDFTDTVADAIVSEINVVSESYSDTVSPHSIVLVDRHSSVSYSASVRKTQIDAISTLNSLQSQINNMNNNLDNIAKNLGYKDRNVFYEYNSDSVTTISLSLSVLFIYGAVGLILGSFLMVAYYSLYYVFGKRIISQSQFFDLFSTVQRIGVCKPKYKRTKYQVYIDKVSGDDNNQSDDISIRYIKANCKNMTAGLKRILVTSTLNDDEVATAVKSVIENGEIQLGFFSNPSIVECLTEYDGVVIVEQRGKSYKNAIKEEIDLIEKSSIKIAGAIVL